MLIKNFFISLNIHYSYIKNSYTYICKVQNFIKIIQIIQFDKYKKIFLCGHNKLYSHIIKYIILF